MSGVQQRNLGGAPQWQRQGDTVPDLTRARLWLKKVLGGEARGRWGEFCVLGCLALGSGAHSCRSGLCHCVVRLPGEQSRGQGSTSQLAWWAWSLPMGLEPAHGEGNHQHPRASGGRSSGGEGMPTSPVGRGYSQAEKALPGSPWQGRWVGGRSSSLGVHQGKL